MVDKKIKSVQPKTGTNHRFFGSRFLKRHNMRDPKWTTNDKFVQYAGLTLLHEKDQQLATLSHAAELKKNQRKLNVMREAFKEDRVALKNALLGDAQRTKNILQNHKELQRRFQSMPSHLVIENMDQETFIKRKELDRLVCKRNQLTKKYETELLDFSKLQDRIKYMDSFELKDAAVSQKLRMELKNSETRLKAVRSINRAYQKMLTNMMQDSLYFEPVLNALQEDLVEQQSFIDTTIRLGRPALANFTRLNKDYERLENQTRRDMEMRLNTLREYRDRIEHNNETVKELVRRDSDFTIFPKRYERQTNSMTNLRTDFEEVEMVMKQVKKITSCDRAADVYPRLTNQFKENQRMNTNVKVQKLEQSAAAEMDQHAQVKEEALNHNLTQAENERTETEKILQEDIQAERRTQQRYEEQIKGRNIMLTTLKMSFQHALDVLRHVGDKHDAKAQPYPNQNLELPLLKFANFVDKAHPPKPFEENVETLQNLLKTRVQGLMKAFDTAASEENLKAGTKVYHDAVLHDMHSEAKDTYQGVGQQLNRLPPEDNSVPTRQQLKTVATRIVELNTKKED